MVPSIQPKRHGNATQRSAQVADLSTTPVPKSQESKLTNALSRMSLEEETTSASANHSGEDDISDPQTRLNSPQHQVNFKSSLPGSLTVAPGGHESKGDEDPLDQTSEAYEESVSDEDRRRRQRVEEIVRKSERSRAGATGVSDSLVAAFDMKRRRSFCYRDDGEESTIYYGDDDVEPVPSLSRSLPPQAPRFQYSPSRSILKKADSEPIIMTPAKELRRQVTFDSVTIREYPMTIGDHPNCSYGPPVTLSWDYDEYESIDVEKFESHRPQRRNLRGMMMNFYRRKNILLHWAGHSQDELDAATASADRIKRQRTVTSTFMPAFLLQEATGGAVRKMKKVVKKSKRKKRS
uniref:Uncharacterized protein n=1 Tax=Pseudictyota dubia TaxID=2749911 RepID=A0A7R9W5E3_9STRA|mmetsp:Transcript_34483/g.63725  ORF Transcript_34483/g.63725 Transcript_34483/m.63725 type:complete len:350 (+) Transcript_34483:385-1434(+)|eukprot:CAMPEP_0197443384 /NCGR_PEP_ID=MMETSP1175-20131217/9124_1 /TAXON_ID=1003142 /ORGANISM="Triceratium dubium, Strain CCMP147" /LENGTH=349 /DNA_ID=CAMNT_0042974001 /DNA_START=241 /DNA_END=1290 /DNA_ORIENTATION=-